MKAFRTIALLLLVLFGASFLYQAKADNTMAVPALEQCAAELSQCTSYKYYKNENTERYIRYRLVHTDYKLEDIISYVNIGLDQAFYTNPVAVANPTGTNVLVNKYRLLPSNFVPARLEIISSLYSYGTQKLTHEARLAFEKLCADAKKVGYPIWATSSYRNYDKQAAVYASFLDPNDPGSAARRELLVSRPGFSEHQTGLAVDFSRVNASTSGADVNKWMANNAYKYGFIIRYPAGKEGVTGVTNEPWHLRYLGVKLATAVYKSGYTYDEYYAREIDIPHKSTDVTAVGVTASSNISVDGTPYQLSSYKVLGDTYYKLRDIAVILNGTSLAFDIAWNSEAKSIEVLKGVPYSFELRLGAFESGHIALLTATNPALQAIDTVYALNSYAIGGSNYFKLGDIMNILNITITDDGTGTMRIDTGTTNPRDQQIDILAPTA